MVFKELGVTYSFCFDNIWSGHFNSRGWGEVKVKFFASFKNYLVCSLNMKALILYNKLLSVFYLKTSHCFISTVLLV